VAPLVMKRFRWPRHRETGVDGGVAASAIQADLPKYLGRRVARQVIAEIDR
jgi:hypothetical protein